MLPRLSRAGLALFFALALSGGPAKAACPAETSEPKALIDAGLALLAGKTGPADPAAAAACFARAADAGDPGAALALGHLALAGQGGPKDPTRAARWFLKAAEGGSPQGRLQVGLAFAAGSGLPRQPFWASYYLRQALAGGGLTEAEQARAQAALREVDPALTSGERERLDGNLAGAR